MFLIYSNKNIFILVDRKHYVQGPNTNETHNQEFSTWLQIKTKENN